ncbi:DMT family transporter [Limibacillus halophilus]|uniref:Drug/metabolite transporter (DMT)-like permease n=1 Tax=Limibacillus halophilus TaxID=1579333 RepID=A0A839SQ70_9PROT|nr:DMT family transporter [Limibacillus halophilus]MBB3065047.1 drug/metabolite transporter (DMT)-like permease [Limibacillus halophilus]
MTAENRDTTANKILAPRTGTEDNAAKGIVLMLLAIALLSAMDASVKYVSDDYPVIEVVFFRSLFAFFPIAFVVLRDGNIGDLKTRNLRGHLGRSLVGLMALMSFFYCLKYMPLADLVAISFAAPLFVTALSIPLLGEKVGLRRWTALLVGFVGVLIMVKPGSGVFGLLALIAIGATFCYALVLIFVRKLSRTETNAAIVFYYSLTSVVATGLLLPFFWVTPTFPDLLLLIAIGLIGGCAQLTMTAAFRAASVSIVAPFEYTAMFWAVIYGYLLWGDLPGWNIWVGAAVLVASGIYIVHRETNLGVRRAKAARLQAKR